MVLHWLWLITANVSLSLITGAGGGWLRLFVRDSTLCSIFDFASNQDRVINVRRDNLVVEIRTRVKYGTAGKDRSKQGGART